MYDKIRTVFPLSFNFVNTTFLSRYLITLVHKPVSTRHTCTRHQLSFQN